MSACRLKGAISSSIGARFSHMRSKWLVPMLAVALVSALGTTIDEGSCVATGKLANLILSIF